jgi:hypothetical protein
VTRPATREERQLAFLWLAAAASAVALRRLWLALATNLSPCVFRSLTGMPCPTCGTTHAAIAFLHGDLAASFAANPLAAAAGLLFVAGAPLAAIWAVAGWPTPVMPNPISVRARVAAVVIIAANWCYLITTA